jgi:protein-disulfide isomerase
MATWGFRALAIPCVVAVTAAAGCRDAQSANLSPTARTLAALSGVPQDGITLGRRDAPVTLTVYSDVTTRIDLLDGTTFDRIMRRYVRPGRLRIQLRTVPETPDPQATESNWQAARALQAAGIQDRLWQLYAIFDAEYIGSLSDEDLRAMARSVRGLDAAELLRDARSDRVTQAINRAVGFAQSGKVTSLPAFVLQRNGGPPLKLHGALEKAVDSTLAGV